MDKHDNFERILKARQVPMMRSNLPERIIAASLVATKPKVSGVFSWLSDFWDGFALPQPVLAMAVALFIGVFVGMSSASNASSDNDYLMQSQIQADLGDIL